MNNLKLPPSNNDAEESVLGSLLINGDSIFMVAEKLQPNDFYFENNGFVFEACLNLYKRGVAVNQVTVAQELSQMGKLDACGGVAKLNYMISVVPTSLDIEHYARIVTQLSTMRKLINAGDKITAIGYEESSDEELSLAQAESLLFNIRKSGNKNELTPIRVILDKYFETKPNNDESYNPELTSIKTGFRCFDDYFMGFKRSDLIILAGRPSMGKTSLALNIARNSALIYRACTAIFSLEMSRDALVLRFISSESGVNSKIIEQKEETEEEEQRIIEATGVLADAPIFIDDSPILRMADIRSKALRLSFEHKLDLIVIDYLQLIQGESNREGNRVQEISYICRALKALARELNVPVIVLSQLNRAVEGRASHEPQLSDLRESGSIEQDADIVMFVYRDEYYYKSEEEWLTAHPDREFPLGEADIIIAKHRNGATGRLKMRFVHSVTRFEDLN